MACRSRGFGHHVGYWKQNLQAKALSPCQIPGASLGSLAGRRLQSSGCSTLAVQQTDWVQSAMLAEKHLAPQALWNPSPFDLKRCVPFLRQPIRVFEFQPPGCKVAAELSQFLHSMSARMISAARLQASVSIATFQRLQRSKCWSSSNAIPS